MDDWTPGPILIPKRVNPNTIQADTLEGQAMAANPLDAERLRMLAALERKYAIGAANAQNVVQQAGQRDWNPILTATMYNANMDRKRIENRAANEYDAELRKQQLAQGQAINPAMQKTLIRWDL